MNLCWALLVVIAGAIGVIYGLEEEMTQAMLSSGADALSLCLALAGAFALWTGLLNVMKQIGLLDMAATAMKGVMRLFPGIGKDHAARADIAANLAANLLGMGNAATPAGMEAVRKMHRPGREAPSDAICMFLVINASSIQLMPTTVISMRLAAGAAAPADILVPTLLATACSTLSAVLFMKLYFLWEGKRRGTRLGVADTIAAGRSASSGRVSPRRGL